MAIDYVKKTATPTANKGLTTLMQSIDELQLARRPLAPHAVSQLGDEDKKLYATMLAVLLVNQTINEAQSRLLQLLLNSMKLDIPLASLYDRVAQFDKTQLQAFCALCDSHQLAPSFFMDVLVLCRLDKALSDEQVKSLAELATLLGVKDSVMKDILHLANKVLQHGDKEKYSVKAMAEAKVALEIDFDYDKLKPWHAFSYLLLDEDKLKQGINGGHWLISKKIKITESISIQNSIILCGQKAILKFEGDSNAMGMASAIARMISNSQTQPPKFNITIENCYISNPNFEFKFIHGISLLNSIFYNGKFNILSSAWMAEKCEFSHAGNVISTNYFSFQDCEKIDFSKCSFNTKLHRAILVEATKTHPTINFLECKFIECGNEKLEFGGAVAIDVGSHSYTLKCIDSEFKDNIAQVGEDLYFSRSYQIDIRGTNFITSQKEESKNWEKFAKNHIAIYVQEDISNGNWKVFESNFINSSIMFNYGTVGRNSINYTEYTIFNSCKFRNSYLITDGKSEINIFYKCEWENDGNQNLINLEEE